jgi:hypothetical protein
MVSCLTNSREEHMITLPDDESSEEGSSDEEEEGSGDGSEEAASSEGGEDAAGSGGAGAAEHAQAAAGEQAEAEVSTAGGALRGETLLLVSHSLQEGLRCYAALVGFELS